MKHSSAHEELLGEVITLDELTRKYHLAEPDGYVGSPAGRLVIDYGQEPVVLADSSRSESARAIQKRILSG